MIDYHFSDVYLFDSGGFIHPINLKDHLFSERAFTCLPTGHSYFTGGSRAISIPQLPKPLLPPRLRSSVEGLNQEIERLVLRPSHIPADDIDDLVRSYFVAKITINIFCLFLCIR